MSNEYTLSNYRINDLIDEQFDDLAINLVDFKRHLQPDKTLEKYTTMGPDGRPIKAEYFYESVLHARIDFEFTKTPDNLLVSRTEKLFYIKNDDSDSPAIYIKQKTYNHGDLNDATIVVQERVKARQTVLEEIKAFTIGVLSAPPYSNTITQIITMIKPFWDEHATERSNFVELGDESFKGAIAAIDTSVDHTWLASPFNLDGNTLQDYYVSRLTW